jgi:hypothetical protein
MAADGFVDHLPAASVSAPVGALLPLAAACSGIDAFPPLTD